MCFVNDLILRTVSCGNYETNWKLGDAQMNDTSLPVEMENQKEQEEEEEEAAVIETVQSPEVPDEGCVSPAVAPVPSEKEPRPAAHVPAAHAHCQAWLLDMLDDVRYLISCTNWY